MSLHCPYCQQSFEPSEILFYTDAVQKDFFTLISDARDISATGTAEIRESVLTNNVVRTRRQSSLRSDTENHNEREKLPEEKAEQQSTFPLGIPAEDVVAANFMKNYGAGVDFHFQRTATFYGVKGQNEITEADMGYGYPCQWEDEHEKKIPSMLYVPSKDKKLTQRICPKCHCDLPEKYFSTPAANHHVAALAGCTSAGKTQFITVALRDLERQLSNLHLGTVEWTKCSKWFHDLYVRKFESNKRMDGTKTTYKLFPLMLTHSQAGVDDVHFMSFFDCAGEYANNADFAANQRSFQEADTLLLMVGCDQLFASDVELSNGELECNMQYLTALAPLKKYDLCSNLKHCIVVLTKCDAIIGRGGFIHGDTSAYVNDGMVCATYDMTCHDRSLDKTVIRRVEEELIGMLTSHHEEDFKQNIASDLSLDSNQVNLLAVSTYKWSGNELVCDPKAVGGHHRVTEPLLLAMSKWDMIASEEKEEVYQDLPVDDEPRSFWQKLFGGKRRN